MPPLFFVLAAGAPAPSDGIDRVETQIEARIGEDLERAQISVKSAYTPAEATDAISIVLPAERLKKAPKGMRASEEREVFHGSASYGGFARVAVRVGGIDCKPEAKTLDDETVLLFCPLALAAGETALIQIE